MSETRRTLLVSRLGWERIEPPHDCEILKWSVALGLLGPIRETTFHHEGFEERDGEVFKVMREHWD